MFEAVTDLMTHTATEADPDSLCLTDTDLLGAVEELVRLGRRVDAMAARLLAVADARGSADIAFGHRTAPWLAHTTRDPKGAAHRRLRAGRGCRRLPLVASAWADGRLALDHVTVLSRAVANPRVADHIIGLQQLLIDRAQEIPFETWRTEMLGIVDTLDTDGTYRPDPPDTPSVLHLLPLFDGTTQLHGELNAADTATISQALNDEADALFRRYTRDTEHTGGDTGVPPRSQLLAEALVSLCRKATAVDINSTTPTRPETVIVIRADTPDTATVNGGDSRVDTSRLGGLLTDTHWRRVVLDPNGDVIDLGRTVRLATTAQRRALTIRDGGCVFPGCDAPAPWCDAHHLTPWEHGGDTNLDNLILLCRHHHGVTHRNGWTTHTHNGHHTWTTPTGHTLHAQRHRQPVGATPVPTPRPQDDRTSESESPDEQPQPARGPTATAGRRRWSPTETDPPHSSPSHNSPPAAVVA